MIGGQISTVIRSGVKEFATKVGGKDASTTLSMTKRLTCVTSVFNFKTAS